MISKKDHPPDRPMVFFWNHRSNEVRATQEANRTHHESDAEDLQALSGKKDACAEFIRAS
jgi:hypothetical protein